MHPDHPDFFFHNNMKIWVPGLLERNPGLSRETVERYLHRMYDGVDFVLTVDRDFVRHSTVPLLVLPDEVPAHPYTEALLSAVPSPDPVERETRVGVP